jgi:hypothetical protein
MSKIDPLTAHYLTVVELIEGAILNRAPFFMKAAARLADDERRAIAEGLANAHTVADEVRGRRAS